MDYIWFLRFRAPIEKFERLLFYLDHPNVITEQDLALREVVDVIRIIRTKADHKFFDDLLFYLDHPAQQITRGPSATSLCEMLANEMLAIVRVPRPRHRLLWDAFILLGMLKEERAVEPLLALLKDERGWVRMRAAYALGDIGDKQATESLFPLLQDERDDIRWIAAGALGRLGDERALEPLLSVLEDSCLAVRCFAVDALRKTGLLDFPVLASSLARVLDDPTNAVQIVRALREQNMQPLRELLLARLNLNREDHEDRIDVVSLLGYAGDEHVAELLIAMFDQERVGTQLRIFWALERLSTGPGAPLTMRIMLSLLASEHSSLRFQGARTLAWRGEQEDIPQLTALLDDPDEKIREVVASALKRHEARSAREAARPALPQAPQQEDRLPEGLSLEEKKEHEQMRGRPVAVDPQAQSADVELPAFMAPPPGAPVYYGFVILEDVEVEGFRLGKISDFEALPDMVCGDAFVIAPDGSRAGLVWEQMEEEEVYVKEVCAIEPERWGVWAVGFPYPMTSRENARRNLRAILPSLQEKWRSWREHYH